VPVGAAMAATGIMAALVERASTQTGCHIDISLADSATWLLSGAVGELSGIHHGIPISPGRRLYRCGDGRFISVAAAEPRTWAALCNALELPDLVERVNPTGVEGEAVTDRLGAIFESASAGEWVDRLGPLGTAVGAVNRGAEVVHDPHNQVRRTTVEVGGLAVPANPIRMRDLHGPRSGTAVNEPATIGSGTDAALQNVGFSPGEIDELRASGVV
jgi:alpha-methylacyl-CoA racemase